MALYKSIYYWPA